MFENLSQYGSAAFWIMQAVVGVIFIAHGAAKLKNKSALMGGTVHGVIEIAAGLALVINQYAQYAAAIIAVIMLGALYFKIFKWKAPFLVMQAAGWEFDLLLLAVSLAILTRV
ncbi:MAG: hypothetical protein A3C85_01980 [Candidatus Doudnabacteria bacterium RIFCSPHIGHO2_02_FULL_48_21]|uniref:DoxX family protein n=1 Tax=Candidatus Doudnabacteria bacterium RIFCSPLOWO2_02_FULL_48_13 TaxID=1817845 RepID=A0A1F5Q8T6_9BACT|nr:MAG: hypothetical protein A3K05_02185 [Candidatus Doudnabacteria bacterium RIFCSPHIGHO2_01_48_18]OGE79843.1 MAG: hypothetical protein A2668_03745 [Candidatus Doudnabacteria bacterium RIFCSPHIGHO2_01_FULL_48_180]OGE91382.1 MAG: hypothetical protein A3F44_03735 [Candidatus Doudnabacteria bacterium RIFCSPHIGHO2_12_FULL_47_25]OGE93194.1 MAG: hypothetical protein A3C85_01980 [Candidatus Doudnabacteria bacterium RIFCSPHIGHO2_02_FULL_48_21]OGE96715.1 MAG: hypothetical protein A3A83_02855 [Candidatu